MAELSWKDAIVHVLRDNEEAMHYTEIAEAIAEQELRSDFGATPANTVNSIISSSISNEGEHSVFIRIGRGKYALSSLPKQQESAVDLSSASGDIVPAEQAGLINAFGMYWAREKIVWANTPRLLGQQQSGSKAVDFCGERGVYLLHDGRQVVYVGRTTDQPLGVRLRQHLTDRLNSRWNRFSWFGVFPVSSDGLLDSSFNPSANQNSLIATMEALLIEGLEPPQNRKRGDEFRAVEFLQVEDPDIRKAQLQALMDEIKTKF